MLQSTLHQLKLQQVIELDLTVQ